jgi:DNA-directed RNA polymerase specialized sigma24 family protein
MDCVELRLSGMKQSEIASALGLKIGTVGVLLSRAGKKVRAAVQPGGDCAAA